MCVVTTMDLYTLCLTCECEECELICTPRRGRFLQLLWIDHVYVWASQGSRVRFGGDSYDVLFEAYAPAQIAKRMHTVAYHLEGARHGRGLRGGHL